MEFETYVWKKECYLRKGFDYFKTSLKLESYVLEEMRVIPKKNLSLKFESYEYRNECYSRERFWLDLILG